jgi:DNA-binding PadR family transcriptional regulator
VKGTYLGEFEEIVLLTVGILHQDAYGNAVKEEIEDRTARKVNLSAIHSALYRLEGKGFLESSMGESTQQRGGKRKKIFKVTNYGQRALTTSKDLRAGLWLAYEPLKMKEAT